eukprot:Opistho-2@35604
MWRRSLRSAGARQFGTGREHALPTGLAAVLLHVCLVVGTLPFVASQSAVICNMADSSPCASSITISTTDIIMQYKLGSYAITTFKPSISALPWKTLTSKPMFNQKSITLSDIDSLQIDGTSFLTDMVSQFPYLQSVNFVAGYPWKIANFNFTGLNVFVSINNLGSLTTIENMVVAGSSNLIIESNPQLYSVQGTIGVNSFASIKRNQMLRSLNIRNNGQLNFTDNGLASLTGIDGRGQVRFSRSLA